MSSVIERLKVEMEPARSSLRIVCCEREHLRKLIAAYEAVKAVVDDDEDRPAEIHEWAFSQWESEHMKLRESADRAVRELEGE